MDVRLIMDASGTTLIFAPATYIVDHVETGKLILMGDLLDNLIRYLTESKLMTLDDVTQNGKVSYYTWILFAL